MVTLNVNGKLRDLDPADEMPSLWTPRDLLSMIDKKFGCGMAPCGPWTISVDEQPTRSCLTLRVELIAVAREMLATSATASNDIDAHEQADVKVSHGKPHASS